MFIKIFFGLLMFLSQFAIAEADRNLAFELNSSTSQRNSDQNPDQVGLKNWKLSYNKKLKETYQFELEFFQSFEQKKASLRVEKISIEVLPENKILSGKLGLYPVPLGQFNLEGDELFLVSPYFQKAFWGKDQLILTGAHINYHLGPIVLSSGVFQQTGTQSPENSLGAPSVPPHFASITFNKELFRAQLSYFSEKQNLGPRKNQVGLGLKYALREFTLSSEIWQESRSQIYLENQESIGGYGAIFWCPKTYCAGVRVDRFSVTNLKDVEGNGLANMITNQSLIGKMALGESLDFHLETIQETRKVGDINRPLRQGIFSKLSYHLEF